MKNVTGLDISDAIEQNPYFMEELFLGAGPIIREFCQYQLLPCLGPAAEETVDFEGLIRGKLLILTEMREWRYLEKCHEEMRHPESWILDRKEALSLANIALEFQIDVLESAVQDLPAHLEQFGITPQRVMQELHMDYETVKAVLQGDSITLAELILAEPQAMIRLR